MPDGNSCSRQISGIKNGRLSGRPFIFSVVYVTAGKKIAIHDVHVNENSLNLFGFASVISAVPAGSAFALCHG
jgi:hypothetical protein